MTDNDSKSRRSLPQRAAKRKPDELDDEIPPEKKSKPEVAETSTLADDVPEQLSYRWIDPGEAIQGGSTEHKLLEMVVDGVKSIISIGDCILLRSSAYDDQYGTLSPPSKKKLAHQVAFVAQVVRMWEENGRKKLREDRMKIRARWFFKKEDFESLGGPMVGPISLLQLVGTMTNRDLVLSDQADDNDVLTILSKCTVMMRHPSDNDPLPNLPLGVFVSRYNICFGDTPGCAVLTPFVGEDDVWPLEESDDGRLQCSGDKMNMSSKEEENEGSNGADNTNTARQKLRKMSCEERNSSKEGVMSSDSDTESDEISSTSLCSNDIFDGEGSTKGRILVGSGHQVTVAPFKGRSEVHTRNPIQIWKPNQVDQTELNAYFAQSADILTPYLKRNNALMEQPYLPLPTEKADVLIEGQRPYEFLTLSDVSTASSMSKQRHNLTRECNVDDLLELLHQNNYNVENAVKALALSPRDYLTLWSRKEKKLFETGFRRFSGSLRMISNGIALSKTFKDIVDYHYRFKIPDQFRRYQDKKRDHAVRMMNIVERRRNLELPIQSRSDEMIDNAKSQRERKGHERKSAQDWAKTAMPDVMGSVEDRRATAKELLLSIQLELGRDVMIQIAEAITVFHQSSVADLKERVVELLREKPELLGRFLEFLPKRFRF